MSSSSSQQSDGKYPLCKLCHGVFHPWQNPHGASGRVHHSCWRVRNRMSDNCGGACCKPDASVVTSKEDFQAASSSCTINNSD
jgi:hypothetical protein